MSAVFMCFISQDGDQRNERSLCSLALDVRQPHYPLQAPAAAFAGQGQGQQLFSPQQLGEQMQQEQGAQQEEDTDRLASDGKTRGKCSVQ